MDDKKIAQDRHVNMSEFDMKRIIIFVIYMEWGCYNLLFEEFCDVVNVYKKIYIIVVDYIVH